MRHSDQSFDTRRIELDTEDCELSPDDIERLEDALSPLRPPVKDFPSANLYVTIEHIARPGDRRVKTALRLPGKGLAAGDVDEEM